MESEQRIIRLQKALNKMELDGALFVYPIDVYYFTGTRQNSTSGFPLKVIPCSWCVRAMPGYCRESHRRYQAFSVKQGIPNLFDPQIKRIGFTFDILPVQQYQYYSKMLPGREFTDISPINRELRSVKSEWELEQMRHSGDCLCSVFAQVPEFLKEGMRELDLAAEFECRLRKAGGEGYVRMRAFNQELFHGLAVSGATSDKPGFFDGAVSGRGLSAASPQGSSVEKIVAGSPVLLDYTGVFNGYIVDMTRMFVFGQPKPELEKAFATAIAIQQYLVENLKPGMICEDLFLVAASMAEDAGLGRNFMGAPGENARFVGHGVGLELDEYPVLAQGFKVPLQAGQTIAIEPNSSCPGWVRWVLRTLLL